ncbi:MAG TPA: cupredoxin family copper-binding protein [Chloroflexota bacterium]|nr:cupredoxin family copper-binding protein [Chloroflexota bacterium]
MLPRIVWRQRALAWSALPAGSALLLAVACAPAPLPLAAHAAMPLVADAGMPTAAHAPMEAHGAMSMEAHAEMPMEAMAGHAMSALASVAPPAAGSADTVSDSPLIDIQSFQFSTPTLTVPAGTTVTWTNHDVEPHTVTADDRSFGSRGLDTNETFAFTFDTPGTYAYHCALHPQMRGQIVVQ